MKLDTTSALIQMYRAAMAEIVSISRDSRLSAKQYRELIKELDALAELFRKHRDNPG